jgi:hypothetical protein
VRIYFFKAREKLGKIGYRTSHIFGIRGQFVPFFPARHLVWCTPMWDKNSSFVTFDEFFDEFFLSGFVFATQLLGDATDFSN